MCCGRPPADCPTQNRDPFYVWVDAPRDAPDFAECLRIQQSGFTGASIYFTANQQIPAKKDTECQAMTQMRLW